MTTHSRTVEDVAFAAAVLVAVIYGLAEAASRLGLALGACGHEHGVPWGLVIMTAALVLPKSVGRATAGAVWTAIANRLGGQAPKGPEE